MKRIIRSVVPALLVLSTAMAARGQVAAPKPFLRAGIVSVDAINKLCADLGLPMTGNANPATQMERAPFIGQGGIDTTRPVGITIFADDQRLAGSLDGGIVIALPITEGHATPEAIKAAGGAPVEGKENIFSFAGSFVRNADNKYLFMGKNDSALIESLAPEPFASDFKQPDTLAVLSFDIAALRTAPNAFKQALEGAGRGNPMMPGSDAGADFARSILNSLDRINVSLTQDEANLHFKTWIRPIEMAEIKPAPRPAFPQDVIFQTHFIFPEGQTNHAVTNMLVKTAMEDPQFRRVSAANKPQLQSQIEREIFLSAGGRAFSLAVSFKGGEPIMYMVNQIDEDIDVAKEYASIQKSVKTLVPTYAEEFFTETVDGKTLIRLVAQPNPSSPSGMTTEIVQDQHVIYTVAGPTPAFREGHLVADLMKLGMKGNSAFLCAGVLNLGNMARNIGELPIPMPISPEMGKQIEAAFEGQGIVWSVQNSADGHYVFADVQVPKATVKAVTGLVTSMQGGGRPRR